MEALVSRPRSRLPWAYDESRQQFTTPTGVVTLHELAALRYGIHTSHIDLHGAWTGWRVRGARIIPPHNGSFALRPDTAKLFGTWIEQGERYWSNYDVVRKLLAKIGG
jgi:hypothetical protein